MLGHLLRLLVGLLLLLLSHPSRHNNSVNNVYLCCLLLLTGGGASYHVGGATHDSWDRRLGRAVATGYAREAGRKEEEDEEDPKGQIEPVVGVGVGGVALAPV